MHENPEGVVQTMDASWGWYHVSTVTNKSIDLETMHSTKAADLFPIDLQFSNPILNTFFRSETNAEGLRMFPMNMVQVKQKYNP